MKQGVGFLSYEGQSMTADGYYHMSNGYRIMLRDDHVIC